MRVPIRFPNHLPALSRPLIVAPLVVVLLIAFIAASMLGRDGLRSPSASMRSAARQNSGELVDGRGAAGIGIAPAADMATVARETAGSLQSKAVPAPGQAANAGGSASGLAGQNAQALPPLGPLPSVDRMIVKTGSVTLQVTELAAAVQRVNAAIAGIPGAYVAASSTSYRAEPKPIDQTASSQTREGIIVPPRPEPVPAPGQTATLTLKVPVDAFGELMIRLRDLGTPLSEQVGTQEVTEEYVDLEAQVRNLEATEQQYIRFLERTQRIEELLPIQQRLTEVRNQIERLRGRMTLLQRRADSSTITVSLVVPVQKSGTGTAGEPRVVRTLREAFGGLAVALQGVLDLAVYVGVYTLPLVPFVLLYLWWRNRHSRGTAPSMPAAGGAI